MTTTFGLPPMTSRENREYKAKKKAYWQQFRADNPPTKRLLIGFLQTICIKGRNQIWIYVMLEKFSKRHGLSERHLRRIIEDLRVSSPYFEFCRIWCVPDKCWRLMVAEKRNLCWDQAPLHLTRNNRHRHYARHHLKRRSAELGVLPFKKPESDICKPAYTWEALLQPKEKQQPATPRPRAWRFTDRFYRRDTALKKLRRKTAFEQSILSKSHNLLMNGRRNRINFPNRHVWNAIETGLRCGIDREKMHRVWFEAVNIVHASNVDGLTRCEPALLSSQFKRLMFEGDDRSVNERVNDLLNDKNALKPHVVRKHNPEDIKKLEASMTKEQKEQKMLEKEWDETINSLVSQVVHRPEIPPEKPMPGSWTAKITEREKNADVRVPVMSDTVSKKEERTVSLKNGDWIAQMRIAVDNPAILSTMKTLILLLSMLCSTGMAQTTTTIFVPQPSLVTITVTPTNTVIIPTNTPPPVITNVPPPVVTNPPPVITGVFSSPTGTPTGTGTQSSPWDLQTGLGKVTSGQTLWLRGGRYNGAYRSASRGSASAPIHVRQFPGEHAQLDGKGFIAQTVLTIASVHTWYWDFEVMNSQTNRYSPEPDSHPTPENMPNGDGVQIEQSGDSGTGDKFINLVVHDTRQGFSLWKEASECEMYGCLVYYNGWLAPDRGHGYGTYQQNGTGRRTMRNCFLWSGFESGFVGYGGDTAPLKNFDLDQNTIFNTAALAGEPNRCFLVGGGQVVENSNFRSNVTWCPNIGVGTGINLGYADAGAGSVNCVVSFNSFFGGKDLSVRSVNLTFANNFLAASPVTFPAGQGNTIVNTMPSDVRIFVRPHQYTPGRSHVTIYSGGTATTAIVTSASLGMANGDHFEQRSVQNFYGSAQQRTVSGANVSFDLNSGPIAQPSGWTSTGTAPKFNGFVVQKQ